MSRFCRKNHGESKVRMFFCKDVCCVKGVRCNLTIVAAPPQLQGDSKQRRIHGFAKKIIILDFDFDLEWISEKMLDNNNW